MERAKIKILERNYFGLRKPIIFHAHTRTNKQGIFVHNYFKKKIKSVILLGMLTILCNTVEITFFLQYLSKTAQIWVQNIERLCQIMQMR